jgi:hypothetical protein
MARLEIMTRAEFAVKLSAEPWLDLQLGRAPRASARILNIAGDRETMQGIPVEFIAPDLRALLLMHPLELPAAASWPRGVCCLLGWAVIV